MKARLDEADALLARFAEYQRAKVAESALDSALVAIALASDNLSAVSTDDARACGRALHTLSVTAQRARARVAKVVAEREIKPKRHTRRAK